MHRFGYSLFSGILFLAGAVGAQQAGQAAPQTPPDKSETKVPVFTTAVIVTGSKTDDRQETVTQKVTVISDDELLAPTNIVRNVSELLQYQPGISVTALSRNDANWGSYGGLGPKYNSYLLDGLPIDSFVDTMSLDQWAFARVETHQGPASVMYSNYLSADFAGTQAPLAGITNLILKDRIDAPVTRILMDGGSWNTLATRLYHQDHNGNLHYFFGATYEQSDYTDYGAPNSWLGMLDDPSYKKVKIYGKATYFAGSHQKVSVFAQHTLHDGFVGRPNRDYGHNYDTVNAVYANQVNPAWDIQLKTGLRNYDRRWGDDNYPTSLALVDHAGVQQQIIPTDLTVTLKHHGQSAFTVGTDFQHATYRTYTEANAPRTTGNDATSLSTGLYAQEKFVSGKWVARAGVRVNHIADTYALIGGAAPGLQEQSWTKGLWSAGVRYNVSTTLSAYANAGTSFISPAAKSVGGTLNPGDVGIVGRNGQLPNPSLQPESGLGSDFGIDLAIGRRATIGVRGFYNRISDAIVDNVVSNTPSQTQSVNAGDVRASGVELVYQHPINDRVRVFSNVTFTRSRISDPLDQDQAGAAVPFVPDYLFNAGVDLRATGSLTLATYLHAVGTYYDSTSKSGRSTFGPYQTLEVRAEQALRRVTSSTVVLFARLENLTNRRYLMPWQFRDPGVNATVGLDVRF